ncbi:MAG: FHA domain-containing protein [Clostridiales bacterium]|nr:FHA domain-containing protein [Clostridiales bacterium]
MSTKQYYLEPGPSGQNYIIHLSEKDGICLHALTILQAGLIGCFLPIKEAQEEHALIIDHSYCTPVSNLKGKELRYVKKHRLTLMKIFLCDLIRSMDHAVSPSAIVYAHEHLYFNNQTKRFQCIYLPIDSIILSSPPEIASFDEHELDELFSFLYENKWLSERAMEKLYCFFRTNDENTTFHYINKEFIEDSRSIPKKLRIMILLWGFTALLILLFSKIIEAGFSGSIAASSIKIIFFISTLALLFPLLSFSRSSKKDGKKLSSEKEKRRKTRNVQMLFPDVKQKDLSEELLSFFSSHPVQFQEVYCKGEKEPGDIRFTIWTNTFTIGMDVDCCDFSIDHPSLSLKHACFGWDTKGLFIEDLSTRKGTFLNRRRLLEKEKGYIHEGDIIGLGDLEFQAHFLRD